MDLFKADPRRIAALIINGKLELSEVPSRRRTIIAECVETLKAEAEAKAKAAAKKPKPKATKGKENAKE